MVQGPVPAQGAVQPYRLEAHFIGQGGFFVIFVSARSADACSRAGRPLRAGVKTAGLGTPGDGEISRMFAGHGELLFQAEGPVQAVLRAVAGIGMRDDPGKGEPVYGRRFQVADG